MDDYVFSAMSEEAILLYAVVAIGPIHPEIETQEVQRSHARFLSPSVIK